MTTTKGIEQKDEIKFEKEQGIPCRAFVSRFGVENVEETGHEVGQQRGGE